jgi:hypothetical protein
MKPIHPLSSRSGSLPRAAAVACLLAAALPAVRPPNVMADQVPSPAITASATAYSAGYEAANLFAPGRNEYATAGQGACSGPLTTNVNDGTWVELDFGATVTFDRFILATRANTSDIVGTNRLYIGSSPVHSTNDTIFTWSSAGDNGDAPIRSLGAAVSGRYARWEALSAPGTDNTGGRHIWFLHVPAGMSPLEAPAVINSFTPYNSTYAAQNAVDDDCGNDASGHEYASQDGTTNTFLDFDFSIPVRISGFDYLNREVDIVTSFELIFSDDPTFTTTLTTNFWTADALNGNTWASGTFAPITARYVRFQVTAVSAGSVNTGCREMLFYTPAGQSPTIRQNPQSTTGYLDDIVSLSVVAAGDPPLLYQWWGNATPLVGATNSILTFNYLQSSNAGSYSVVISNAFGNVTSTAALLAVTNPPVDLTLGLVAYYAFDETSGTTAADSSGNGNDATLNNFPSDNSMWVAGRTGGALAFNFPDDQTNNYVETDNPLTFSDPGHFTFSFWAKLLSNLNPYNPRFISPVGNQHWVLWSPGIGVGFYPPADSPEPELGIWEHFVVTYDLTNGLYGLYLNGTKVLNAQSANNYVRTSPDVNVAPWVIGNDESLGSFLDGWRGCLDEVRIYNRILFPTEAKALYGLAAQAAPSFAPQPSSATLYQGQTLWLTPIVNGTPPITFQWQKNGTNVPGANSMSLQITNAQLSDAGNYTLAASNNVQAVTSATAHIVVAAVTSVTNGLAGYWRFDETAGSTAADSSGLGNNGTVNNTTGDGGQWTSGKVGGALQFRGGTSAGDYVLVPSWPSAIEGAMTWSAWVWADALPTRGTIGAGGSGEDGVGQFLLNVNSNGVNELSGYLENTARVTASPIEGVAFPTNSWQHVALVADGATVRLYRNGSQVATAPYSGQLFNPTNALSIGAVLTPDSSAAASGWWQGKMDEVAYWTRGLSAGEIFTLFAAGTAGKPLTQADAYASSPPLITAQPQGGTLLLHEPFSTQVEAAGEPPLTYQWLWDGVAIQGATNQVFSLAAVEFTDAGAYTVVVTTSTGSITSAPAALTISAPLPALESGLVLYLKLDETSGTIASDSTTNANDGTLLNFPTPVANWVPGVINGALLFDQGGANSEAIAVPDQPYLDFGPNPFSLSLWANGPAAQAQSGGLLCKGLGGGDEAYCIDIYPAAYRFFVRNSTSAGGSYIYGPPPSGTWQHLAVIYDPTQGQSQMYVDGALVGTAATVDSIWSNPADTLDIGARQFQGGYTLPWTGLLDDVRVYGRAITPLEVRALNYEGHPPALTASSSQGKVTVSWPFEAAAAYELVSGPALAGAWTPVAGVTTNYITLGPTNSGAFYRLQRKSPVP